MYETKKKKNKIVKTGTSDYQSDCLDFFVYNKENNQLDAPIGSLLKFQS